jgi:hypothetical protein
MKRTVGARQDHNLDIPDKPLVLPLHQALCFTQRELRKPGAYLPPLRVFIGIGWLRARAEKFVEPGWYDGSSLAAFHSAAW